MEGASVVGRQLPSVQSRSGRGLGGAKRRALASAGLARGGPRTPAPSYDDARPLDAALLGLFRRRMAEELGRDSAMSGYDAIVDMSRQLKARGPGASGTRLATQRILVSLFPSWLLPAFRVMFARPFPAFSLRLNAWVTALTCQWLMGKCEVNASETDASGGAKLEGYGVKVERCRYLEETGCAAICLNCCKVPTQAFFAQDMGLPLSMEPNYEDFSCQFKFGLTPPPPEADEAFTTPCFSQCPTAREAEGAKQCYAVGPLPPPGSG